MSISIFDLFSVGIGPSSSHTVGPMIAAHEFVATLVTKQQLSQVARVTIDLFGSLALTGKGHETDKAILNGLEGQLPATVDPTRMRPRMQAIIELQQLRLLDQHTVQFKYERDFLFHTDKTLPKHSNAVRFTAHDLKDNLLHTETYYSVGGGFILSDENFDKESPANEQTLPYPFATGAELLRLSLENNVSMSQIMLANEQVLRSEAEIRRKLLDIAATMSLAPGWSPLPCFTTLYCKPLGNTTTPCLDLFTAKNCWPVAMFCSAVSFIFTSRFTIIFF